MQRRKVVESGGRRVGAMRDRRSDGVNVVAQAARLGEQRLGEGGVGGEPRAQLRRRRCVEGASVLEPVGDVNRGLQVVLVGRKAAARTRCWRS